MSDKLFKNDLTPSVCQSDGQTVASLFQANPSQPPDPLSRRKPPHWRNVSGKDVAEEALSVPCMRSAHYPWNTYREGCTVARLDAKPGTWKMKQCQPFLLVPPSCGVGVAPDGQSMCILWKCHVPLGDGVCVCGHMYGRNFLHGGWGSQLRSSCSFGGEHFTDWIISQLLSFLSI